MKPIYWKNIPSELTRLTRWVVWKHGKVPYVAGTYRRASVTNPKTWRSFGLALDTVRSGHADGIGFVFTNTPYAGVDLDHCLYDGQISHQAARIVDTLSSYTEVSPSGNGLHIIVRANLPPGSRRKDNIELYDSGRYFTFTGHVWQGFHFIEPRQRKLELLHHELFPPHQSPPTSLPVPIVDDRDVLFRAATARNGHKFTRLWEGDTTGYKSHSEADLALCNFLAFWTGEDQHLMDQLFRQSSLYRDKWDEVHYADGRTYGDATIARALT